MKGWRKNDLKGLSRDFTAVYKVEKISLFFVFSSYLKDSAFTAVKRHAKFLTRGVKGVLLSMKGLRKG